MGIAPGHYWVQQLKGKLAELLLTSPLTQGMCLAVVPVAAAEAAVTAVVVAEENKQINVKPQSLCRQLVYMYLTL